MTNKFKIGDRVIANKSEYNYFQKGDKGEVSEIPSARIIRIRFDKDSWGYENYEEYQNWEPFKFNFLTWKERFK